MSAKNAVGDNDKATAVVAGDWEETLKRIGGSQSDVCMLHAHHGMSML
jgi:hypothetical protein